MQPAQPVSRARPGLFRLAVAVVLAAGSPVAAGADARVEVSTTEPIGKYLTDDDGMTLYLFEKDERGRSTCHGACAEAWPPLLTEGDPVAGAGVDADKLSTMRREDGSRQVTYGGWPLYRFVRDAAPGDTNGQDVEGFGAEWYMVSPAATKAQSEAHEQEHEEDHGDSGGYY